MGLPIESKCTSFNGQIIFPNIKESNYPQKMHLDYIKLCGFENDMNLVFSKTETVRKKLMEVVG